MLFDRDKIQKKISEVSDRLAGLQAGSVPYAVDRYQWIGDEAERHKLERSDLQYSARRHLELLRLSDLVDLGDKTVEQDGITFPVDLPEERGAYRRSPPLIALVDGFRWEYFLPDSPVRAAWLWRYFLPDSPVRAAWLWRSFNHVDQGPTLFLLHQAGCGNVILCLGLRMGHADLFGARQPPAGPSSEPYYNAKEAPARELLRYDHIGLHDRYMAGIPVRLPGSRSAEEIYSDFLGYYMEEVPRSDGWIDWDSPRAAAALGKLTWGEWWKRE